MMRQWRRRLRALRDGAALDHDLDEEMQLHLQLEADALARAQGLTTGEARRQARLAFGGVERYKEAHRDARRVRWVEELWQDVRYAARSLRKSPAYSVSAVLVLALGIGACTTIFGAIHAVLLTSLPYPHDERLTDIALENATPGVRWHLSTVDYRALEAQQHSFSSVGVEEAGTVTVMAPGGEPARVDLGFVTSGIFRALGVAPARGRAIDPDDERLGAPPVAVIGDQYATRTFGGAAPALGRPLVIDGKTYTVVGVLAPGRTELGRLRSQIWPALQLATPARRGPFLLIGIGRLGDGVTLDGASRDLTGLSQRLFPLWSAGFQDRTARLAPRPLRQIMIGDASRTLAVFAAAVALVLLVAVANVASLTLVRATGRWREITVRAVLGGTRTRLARLLITESVIVAGVGSLVGLAAAAIGLRLLIAFGPHVARLADARPDLTMVAFAGATALLVGAIVGASPIALLLKGGSSSAETQGSRLVGGRRAHAIRGAFVIAQFALTLPLLAGAGLMLNSFVRLMRVTPGFDPHHLLVVRVGLPGARYANDTTIGAYWARALPVVRAVPGVTSAGLNEVIPPRETDLNLNNFDLLDRPVPPGGAQPVAPWIASTSEYFATMGVPLLEGRLFTPADSGTAPPVVVVSRAWATRFYPGERAVGRRFISGGCLTCPPTTVVGVVGDIKVQGLNEGGDAIYAPVSQGWPQAISVFVRTAGSPENVTRQVQDALRSVDPGVPLDDAAPMEERLSASVVQPRHYAALLGGFAVAALALAAVGIFGMLSYSVSARRREIGVRMALGAQRESVVGMIVWGGMAYALAGAAAGLAVALSGTRWLASALFAVRATDPPTIAAVTGILLFAALGACWLAARRAAAIDPVTALRLE